MIAISISHKIDIKEQIQWNSTKSKQLKITTKTESTKKST